MWNKSEFSKSVFQTVEKVNAVPPSLPKAIVLSERIKACISILRFFGYFPFSFDHNGNIRFRLLSLQFLHSATIVVLYIVGFVYLFLLGNTFDEVFKKSKLVFNRIDFLVFLSEAFLSCSMFLMLVFESWVHQASFVAFWNNLQGLLNDIGDTQCGQKLRKETIKLLTLYAIGTLCFLVLISTGNAPNDPELCTTRLDLAFMGTWSIYGISYIYLFVYCNLMIYSFTLAFQQVEKLIKQSFEEGQNVMGQEKQIYSALDKFERTAELLKDFQSSFGFKLLICISKLCFSTFLAVRLIILVLKGKDKEKSGVILDAAILHTSHLWGLLLLFALCNHTQKMTRKVAITISAFNSGLLNNYLKMRF